MEENLVCEECGHEIGKDECFAEWADGLTRTILCDPCTEAEYDRQYPDPEPFDSERLYGWQWLTT